MGHPVLWQFKYSHYNEKVRWALDYKRVPHVRRSLLPGPHAIPVLWMTGQKAVPVLQLNGRAIADSTRIIAALEETYPPPPLYPADPTLRRRALELEDYFDEQLGPHVRVAWFHEALPDAAYSSAQLTIGFSRSVQRLYRVMFPAVRAIMSLDMGINASSAAKGRAKVNEALDRLEAEVQPSGYLVGETFTIADLTAAALLSPLAMPPEFPYPLLDPPPRAAAYRDSLMSRRGLQWARDIYRDNRTAPAEVPPPGTPASTRSA